MIPLRVILSIKTAKVHLVSIPMAKYAPSQMSARPCLESVCQSVHHTHLSSSACSFSELHLLVFWAPLARFPSSACSFSELRLLVFPAPFARFWAKEFCSLLERNLLATWAKFARYMSKIWYYAFSPLFSYKSILLCFDNTYLAQLRPLQVEKCKNSKQCSNENWIQTQWATNTKPKFDIDPQTYSKLSSTYFL